jgi:bacteriocin biosynthesis cyclodehydratase domain-containing protein
LLLPFTFLSAPDRVRLVAGEDFRYTLSGSGLEGWLPAWLAALDGLRTLDELLAALPPERRAAARQVVAHLCSERVVGEGPAAAAHPGRRYRLVPEGDAALAAGLEEPAEPGAEPLPVLCQDRLDHAAALAFNARCLSGSAPWLWLTCGPLGRGYVSPVFLPDAGPCLACLLGHFRRLSPLPELYDELAEHARAGGLIAPSSFPAPGLAILQQLARWKAELLAEPQPSAALYRLHVLECRHLEVTAHDVFPDPECPACRGHR